MIGWWRCISPTTETVGGPGGQGRRRLRSVGGGVSSDGGDWGVWAGKG